MVIRLISLLVSKELDLYLIRRMDERVLTQSNEERNESELSFRPNDDWAKGCGPLYWGE